MSIKELTQQYKKEKCTNCKNQCKEFTQCCITVQRSNKFASARCDYYEPKGKQYCGRNSKRTENEILL